MATNEELQRAVRAALDVDKRLAHPEEIAVTAGDDVVTLRGTVTSFNQRRAAVGAARKSRASTISSIRSTFGYSTRLSAATPSSAVWPSSRSPGTPRCPPS